jgi:hypothetical protein
MYITDIILTKSYVGMRIYVGTHIDIYIYIYIYNDIHTGDKSSLKTLMTRQN